MLKTAVNYFFTIFKKTCRLLLIISAAFTLVFSAIALVRDHNGRVLLIMIPSVLLFIILYNPTAFPLADLIAGVSALIISFFGFIFFAEYFSIFIESTVDYNTGQFLTLALAFLFVILIPFMAFLWIDELQIKKISPSRPDFTNVEYKKMEAFITPRSIYLLSYLFLGLLYLSVMAFGEGGVVCLIGIVPIILFIVLVIKYRSFTKRFHNTSMKLSRKLVEDYNSADRAVGNQLLLGNKFVFGRGAGCILSYNQIETVEASYRYSAKRQGYLIVTMKDSEKTVYLCQISFFYKKEISLVCDFMKFKKIQKNSSLSFYQYIEKLKAI